MRRAWTVSAMVMVLTAADWPQWRGPNRDDRSPETGLLTSWPEKGPPLVWIYENAGFGYSCPAIVGDRLYCMGAREGTEYLFALDLSGGKDGQVKEAWSAKIGPMFTWKDGGNNWNRGPSATPTVAGEFVYALGGQGELVCVEAAKGAEKWRVNLGVELGGAIANTNGSPEKIGWGHAASPLIVDDLVVCVPGGEKGTLAALEKTSGKVRWRSQGFTDPATYSSPVHATIHGISQIVQVTNQGVAGVAIANGKLVWYARRKPDYTDEVIPTPIVRDEFVHVTLGDRYGFEKLKIVRDGDGFKAERALYDRRLANYMGGCVLVGDHVFGYFKGRGWSCQNFADGKLVWSERNVLGDGSLIFVDGHLILFGQDEGTTVLIEANPKEWKEKGRFELPKQSKNRLSSGRVWTHPVLANGRLYLRDQELLFCYDLRTKK